MYEISVEMDFDAAHYLRGYKGKCESLHGHRFKVMATVKTAKLDDTGMGYDFTQLKKKLGDTLAKFDHICLNDLPAFQNINPSSEHIAKIVYAELKKKLKDAPGALSAVTVWESPTSHVTYHPD